MEIEDRFRDARHPVWIAVYERLQSISKCKRRVVLVAQAMVDEDDQARTMLAESFEKLRADGSSCFFREDLRKKESGAKPKRDGAKISADECSVM
jgi:hypothetical protein